MSEAIGRPAAQLNIFGGTIIFPNMQNGYRQGKSTIEVDLAEFHRTPLDILTEQIVQSAELGFDLLAIGMASALPDICSSLSSEDGRSDSRKYKIWCEKYLIESYFKFITPEDLYSIRCGLLHQGRFVGLRHTVERVIFVPKGPVSMVNCQVNGAYIYGTVEFCTNICRASQKWYDESRGDTSVINNIQHMMDYYQSGISPYIKGIRVVG